MCECALCMHYMEKEIVDNLSILSYSSTPYEVSSVFMPFFAIPDSICVLQKSMPILYLKREDLLFSYMFLSHIDHLRENVQHSMYMAFDPLVLYPWITRDVPRGMCTLVNTDPRFHCTWKKIWCKTTSAVNSMLQLYIC